MTTGCMVLLRISPEQTPPNPPPPNTPEPRNPYCVYMVTFRLCIVANYLCVIYINMYFFLIIFVFNYEKKNNVKV